MKNILKTSTKTLIIATTVTFMANQLALAETDEKNVQAERCISLTRIEKTDVIDDSNILFYMRNNEVYINKLAHRCPGLKRADTFMYKTSLNQLCNLDIITVLDNIGFGFSSGASCGLSSFYPIDKDEAKAMLKKK